MTTKYSLTKSIVTSDQANEEYMKWCKDNNKEGHFEDLILEYCAHLLTLHYLIRVTELGNTTE